MKAFITSFALTAIVMLLCFAFAFVQINDKSGTVRSIPTMARIDNALTLNAFGRTFPLTGGFFAGEVTFLSSSSLVPAPVRLLAEGLKAIFERLTE